MRRRRLLALAGASVVPLAACTGRQTDERTPTGEQTVTGTADRTTQPRTIESPTGTTMTETPRANAFDTVVDVAADLGCEPDDGEPCRGLLGDVDADSVLLRFPAGTYRFAHRLVAGSFERFGLVGDGDVTIRPPDGFNNELLLARAGAVHLANVTVDLSARETTAGFTLIGDRELTVENVTIAGRGYHPDSQVVHGFALAVRNPDGTGVVRNLVARRGSAIGHYKGGNGRTGIWAGGRHRGTLRIENCLLEEFGNNGIYASRCPGSVQVVDSTFRNNNVASVRISGEGSYARNVLVEVDLSSYDGPRSRFDSGFNTRGIVIEQNNVDKSPGARIVDCDVRLLDAIRSQGAIGIGHHGRTVEVSDTTIRVDTDRIPAILRKRPQTAGASGIVLDGVTITGSAAGREAIKLEGAPESVFRDVTIDQPGTERDGVKLIDSEGCLLDGGSVEAGRYPVVVDGGTAACWLLVDQRPQLSSAGGAPDGRTTVDGFDFHTVRGNDCIHADTLKETAGSALDRLGFLGIEDSALTFVVLEAR
jgi:hypothetical protein